MARYDFASDNVAGAMPEVMNALSDANAGFAAGYGDDHVSARAADLIRGFLDADAVVKFVATGTFSNALAVSILAQPHEAALVHEHSHLATDETGAPGFFGHGVGLITLPGASGRIDPQRLSQALDFVDQPHWQSPAALSLTQATEYGCVYANESVSALVGQAKASGLGVHVDGARLANAVAAGFDPKSLAKLGVDILSFGGAKAGSTPTEALVIFNRDLDRRLGARLKHAGQLVSKGRYLSAPWIGLLEGGAMIARAAHANAMAKRLAAAMPFALRHPVEANGVFVEMDEAHLDALKARGWFVYRFIDGSVRFMCSWATKETAVDELAADLTAIA